MVIFSIHLSERFLAHKDHKYHSLKQKQKNRGQKTLSSLTKIQQFSRTRWQSRMQMRVRATLVR